MEASSAHRCSWANAAWSHWVWWWLGVGKDHVEKICRWPGLKARASAVMKDKDSNAKWDRRNLLPSNSQGLSNFIRCPVSNHHVPLVHHTDRRGNEHPLDTSSSSSASSSTFLSSYQDNKSFDKSQLKNWERNWPQPKMLPKSLADPKGIWAIAGKLLSSNQLTKLHVEVFQIQQLLSATTLPSLRQSKWNHCHCPRENPLSRYYTLDGHFKIKSLTLFNNCYCESMC